MNALWMTVVERALAHHEQLALAGVACGGVFALVDFVRWLAHADERRVDRRDVVVDHLRTFAGMLVNGAVFAVARAWAVAHLWTGALASQRLFELEPSAPGAWLGLFLGVDFVHYWVHRAMHRVRLLWAFHVIHHSTERYASLHASRSHVVELLLWTIVYPTALAFVGFPLPMVFLFLVVQAFAGGLNHADFMGRYPLVEGVLNTPTSHRVHHASERGLVDKNFGEFTMIWDRLFSTYAAPPSSTPRLGLTRRRQLAYVPIASWLAELRAIAFEVRTARSWRARLAATFGPPST